MKQENSQKMLEKFIARFAFNADADLEYFYHGLIGEDKSYLEQLRTSIIRLTKSNKATKKSFSLFKVKTDRNEKKIKETFEQLRIDYLRTVELFKDSHHFIVTLMRLDALFAKYDNMEDVVKEFKEDALSFSELVQQIDLNREERYYLNTFNRMRNIVIHAPSGIIMEYLTDNVLEEFKCSMDGVFGVASWMLVRNMDKSLKLLKYRQSKLLEKEVVGTESAKEFAKRYDLDIKELLTIIKETKHDYTFAIHQDMMLDTFSKEAIIEKVKAASKEKSERLKEKQRKEMFDFIYKKDSIFIVDFERALEHSNNDIDKTYNKLQEICTQLKINRAIFFSENKSREIRSAISQLYYMINKTDDKCYSRCDIELIASSIDKSNVIISYKVQESCLDKLLNSKCVITNTEPYEISLV